MATKATRKPRTPKVYANEEAIKAKIEGLKKIIGKGEPTEAQKDQLKAFRAELGGLKFKRLGGTRLTKALSVISGLGKLGTAQYKRNEDQVKFVVDALKKAVAEVEAKLNSTTQAKTEKAQIVIPD